MNVIYIYMQTYVYIYIYVYSYVYLYMYISWSHPPNIQRPAKWCQVSAKSLLKPCFV